MRIIGRLVIISCFFVMIYVLWPAHIEKKEQNNSGHIESNKPHPISRNKPKQCLKNILKDYVLVVNFDLPYYKNIAIFRQMYDGVFGKLLICGPEADSRSGRNKPDLELVDSKDGGYDCVSLAIENSPDFKGYFYIKDNVLLNWWNLQSKDKSKLWQGEMPEWKMDSFLKSITDKTGLTQHMVASCQKYYSALQRFSKIKTTKYDGKHSIDTYIKNGKGRPLCGNGTSNFFYLPKKFASSFQLLSGTARLNSMYRNSAIHNVFRTLDLNENILTINATQSKYIGDKSANLFWYNYEVDDMVVYPLEISTRDKEVRDYNMDKIKDIVLTKKSELTTC